MIFGASDNYFLARYSETLLLYYIAIINLLATSDSTIIKLMYTSNLQSQYCQDMSLIIQIDYRSVQSILSSIVSYALT